MFFTVPNWAARIREDRRPLYRRIFTNRRLDFAHKTLVRSILGFLLFSTSYCIVNTGIYYKYVRPLRQEERERLERELIEADKAGFKMKFTRFMSTVVSRWESLFGLGVAAGAGFELFKIYFSFNGVNYYSVFKKKQLQKELDEFERSLKEMDRLIVTGVPQKL